VDRGVIYAGHRSVTNRNSDLVAFRQIDALDYDEAPVRDISTPASTSRLRRDDSSGPTPEPLGPHGTLEIQR
jgi:hypothetical protein